MRGQNDSFQTTQLSQWSSQSGLADVFFWNGRSQGLLSKREKSSSQIFYDINPIGKFISAYSRFTVMQVWLTATKGTKIQVYLGKLKFPSGAVSYIKSLVSVIFGLVDES